MNNQTPSHPEKKSWFRRHPVATVLLILIVGIPFLAGIFSGIFPKDTSPKKSAVTPEQLAEYQKEFDMVSPDFVRHTDKFSDYVWYEQKTQTSVTRSMLKVMLDEDGTKRLISQYYGNDWIFHNQVQVKIGDVVYTTGTGSPNRSAGSDGVYESNLYDNDEGIIDAIAKSGDTPVYVRLVGKTDHDFTLSKNDKFAILESDTLSGILALMHAAKNPQ